MSQDDAAYFKTIEEHFQGARGTPAALLSSRDWILIEQWMKSGVPLQAVLRGIDETFRKFHSRRSRSKTERINSLFYCAQAVAYEAQCSIEVATFGRGNSHLSISFAEVRAFVLSNAARLRKEGWDEFAIRLESLELDSLFSNIQCLDELLTSIETDMLAQLRANTPETIQKEHRRQLEAELAPYRSRMTIDQLEMLQKKFLERRLLEAAALPRLSLFYM